ncbi:selenite/tellurite reduction operon rhodanese-like protein ExtH [Geoalkalibacter subterraneus]|nr:selenite/tellurite reduction operon rhodanese-like protein ExtH [Geoalkalibacter subterraneus]
MNVKKLFRQHLFVFLIGLALIAAGCGGGSSSYDEPDSIGTSNVLIDAPTLKSWVDAGLVNGDGYENVVILHIGSPRSEYADGHIPGALEWSTVGIDRIDGPLLSGNMVLDGETMDKMLQECGIRKGSTIVFTGDNNLARVYFTFRYWGFPKKQLKILNGSLPAWKAHGYPVTTVTPRVEPSNLSVRDLGGPQTHLRASLSEAIMYVEQGLVTPYNTYSATSDLTAPKITETLDGTGSYAAGAGTGGYVLFQGEMRGAVTDNLVAGLKKTVDINGQQVTVFKDADEMRAFLENDLEVDLSKPIMTYCRAGNLASQGFAPIDAVLGNEVEVMMYDGSWSQWASLTADPSIVPEGKLWVLPDGSAGYDFSDWETYSLTHDGQGGLPFALKDFKGTILWGGETVTFDPVDHIQPPYFYDTAPDSPYDPGANTIEDEDREYYRTGPSDSAPTAVQGAAGGC